MVVDLFPLLLASCMKVCVTQVVKLQKLLRRAEQMIAENKKQHKDMQVAAEQDKAKIAALEVQIAQMVTRGLKVNALWSTVLLCDACSDSL